MSDSYRDKINFYKKRMLEYEGKLITVGLSEKDRKDIISILKMIYKDKTRLSPKKRYLSLKNKIDTVELEISKGIRTFNTEFEYWSYNESKKILDDLKPYAEQIDNIEKKLHDMVVLLNEKVHVITPREFILRNSMLTHLVYTNNKHTKIKPRSADSFMFLCQIHSEKSPSMLVNNSRNFLMCFGCGCSLDSIEYLMRYEGLTEEDAISVLANIYYLNYPDKKKPIDELQDKYIKTLLSDDFRLLLERGYSRTKTKEKTIFVTEGIAKFEQDFETINRVSKGEYKDYVLEHKPKVYVKRS